MSTLLQYGDPVAAGVDAVRLGRARQVAAGCVTEESRRRWSSLRPDEEWCSYMRPSAD